MLAQYTFRYNPPQAPKIPEEIKHFRSLVRYKETLTEDRTREIARLKSSRDSEVKKLIQKQIIYIEKRIKDVTDKIETIIISTELLKKYYELLITIPGIGFNLASRILAELNFEDIENISPKSLVAHAGLSPSQYESAISVKGRERISKIGSSDFRKDLFMPALSCIHSNNYFTQFYLHLLENGKPKKVAITATMRKILLTAGGVLRTKKPFDPNWSKKVQVNYQKNLKIA
jgi:transposase